MRSGGNDGCLIVIGLCNSQLAKLYPFGSAMYRVTGIRGLFDLQIGDARGIECLRKFYPHRMFIHKDVEPTYSYR